MPPWRCDETPDLVASSRYIHVPRILEFGTRHCICRVIWLLRSSLGLHCRRLRAHLPFDSHWVVSSIHHLSCGLVWTTTRFLSSSISLVARRLNLHNGVASYGVRHRFFSAGDTPCYYGSSAFGGHLFSFHRLVATRRLGFAIGHSARTARANHAKDTLNSIAEPDCGISISRLLGRT